MFEENIGYSITVHDKNNMLACLRKFFKYFCYQKQFTIYINLEIKLALSTSICGRLRWYSAANFCKIQTNNINFWLR